MKKIKNTELINLVNELYHDKESEVYDSMHKEIFLDEVQKINKIKKINS